ncbi:hypothetical protein EV690_2134 [Celerinatantimonas diazotrophica]|uniref:Helix-turn-helix protein n=1 Tax=Celerinatantimonas diazotrophica TaxID=412034 RepID=A0A4R1JLU0_9GAMM|nr:hypothetical protein EV690_2134 [Celerinatantimonas diazotrophica]CAG9296263.1 hypothetical protein CEDIAZO_01411 [Celerinatantimonas diazotrophica]
MDFRAWRIYRGYTKRQLAHLCKVSTRCIRNIEKEQKASADLTTKLYSILSIPPDSPYPPAFRNEQKRQNDVTKINEIGHWFRRIAYLMIVILLIFLFKNWFITFINLFK